MHRSKHAIGICAWLSLYLLQLSGLHAHADEHGFIGAPEAGYAHSQVLPHQHGPAHDSHAHDGAKDGHTHEHHGVRDVSFFELASGKLKLSLEAVALVLLLAVGLRTQWLVRVNFAYRILSGRHTRWRPPLRAPPAYS